MELIYISFIWVVSMLIFYTWKWKKENKKKGVKDFKYPMTMSIGERIRRKKKMRW